MTVKTENMNGRTTPDITTNLLYLGVYVIALVIAEWFKDRIDPGARPGQAAVVVLAAVIGAIVWIYRKSLYQALTVMPFAVAILILLCIATILGTIIIQGAAPEQLAEIYGPNPAKVFAMFRLHDIFHSLWFGGLIALLSTSLILVALRRKMWKLPKLGTLLSHLGVVVILVGGLIGFFTGFKGFIDIREGEQVSAAVRTQGGAKTGESRDLGFTVRLDDFEIDKYETGFRLYIYALGKKDFEVKKSLALDEVTDWVELSGGYDFRVTKVYPDFYQKMELKEAEAGKGRPALMLSLAPGEDVHLFAGALSDEASPLIPGGPPFHFVWEAPSEETLAARGSGAPERHVIIVRTGDSGGARETAVEVGKSYVLADGAYELTVLEYQPDFVIDTATKKASSRSPNPNNPALWVSVKTAATAAEEKKWLFANMPDFSMQHGKDESGPGLVYEYRPASGPPETEIIVIGSSRELIRLASGKAAERKPLGDEAAGVPELGASKYRIYPAATELETFASRSEEMNNPVAELELRTGSDSRVIMLPALHSEPLRVPDGKTILTFEKKPDEVKAYRSKMTVLDNGKMVREQVVAVNHPLSYKGSTLYQSSYKEEDPTYSGLQVVRDPGLGIVWVGFVMISLGVIYTYYVRPQVLKRRNANAG